MTKITFKDDEMQGIINNLNNCINDYKNRNNLFNLLEDIKNQKENIVEYKLGLNKYVNELNKNELELLSKISKLDEINVSKFS